jgi:mRNA interferase MazF
MVNQYEVYWVNLNPTQGSEINKTRPCVIISPNVSNEHLNTVLVAPITSTIRNMPTRIDISINNRKSQVALDQIRCVDKNRFSNRISALNKKDVVRMKSVLKEYLID